MAEFFLGVKALLPRPREDGLNDHFGTTDTASTSSHRRGATRQIAKQTVDKADIDDGSRSNSSTTD